MQQIANSGDESGQETQSLSSYVAKKILSFLYNPFSRKNTESPAPVEGNEGRMESIEPYEESASDENKNPPARSDDADDEAAQVGALVQNSKAVISHIQTKELHHDDTNVFSSASAHSSSLVAQRATPLVSPLNSGFYPSVSPPTPTPAKRAVTPLPKLRERESKNKYAPTSSGATEQVGKSSKAAGKARAIDNPDEPSPVAPKRSSIKRRAPQSFAEDEADSRLVSPKCWRYRNPGSEYETNDESPLFTPRNPSPHSSESSKRKRGPEAQDNASIRPAPTYRNPSHQYQPTRRRDFIYVPGSYYTRDIDVFIGAMPRPVSALDFAMDAHLAKLRRELPMPVPQPRATTPKLMPDASGVSSLEKEESLPQSAGRSEVLRRCEERTAAILAHEQNQALDRHNARSKVWNDAAARRRDQVPSYGGLREPRMEHRRNFSTTAQSLSVPTSSRRRVLARSETFIELPSTAKAVLAHDQARAPCAPPNEIRRGAGRRTAKLVPHPSPVEAPLRRSSRASATRNR